MAVLLTSTCVDNDPLTEAYFSRAAGELGTHRSDGSGSCACCRVVWPCPKALAAAFLLDIHSA